MMRGDTCLMDATDIRVWGVHPISEPEQLRALAIPEDVRATWLPRIPLGRIGDPADVAAAIAFLAGPDAAYITGQVLQVDGGSQL